MRKASIEDLKMELWLRLRDEKKIKWTCRNGKQIAIKDMSFSHLTNTIKMLQKQEDDFDHIGDGDNIL